MKDRTADMLFAANVALLAILVVLIAIYFQVDTVEDLLQSIDSNLGQLVEEGTFLRVPPPMAEGA